MNALRFPGRNQWEVVDLPRPEPDRGEVLVRVRAAGICHTDVEILRGNYPTRYPVVPGHEFAGVVESAGPGLAVSGWTGQRVVVDPNRPCRDCPACRAGLFNKCFHLKTYGSSLDGGFQEFVAVSEECLLPVPPLLSFEEAALAEPLACVLHGLNRLTVPPGVEVLIFGAGPIGLLMLAALRRQNDGDGDADPSLSPPQVTMVDRQPARLEAAVRLGAAAAVLADDLRQKQKEFAARFSVVIDATGSPAVVETLPRYTRDRGTILLFGVCPPDVRINYSPYEVYYREITLLGSYSLNGELPQALALLGAGVIPAQEIITHRVSLAEVPAYLSDPGGGGTLKVQAVFPT